MAQIVSNQTSLSSIYTYLSVSATATRKSSGTVDITASWTVKTGSGTSYNSTARYLVLCNSSGTPLGYQLMRSVWAASSTYNGSCTFSNVSVSSSATSLRITFKTSGSNTSQTTSAPLIFNGDKKATVTGGSPGSQYGNVTFSAYNSGGTTTTTPTTSGSITAVAVEPVDKNSFILLAKCSSSSVNPIVYVWSTDYNQADMKQLSMTGMNYSYNGVTYTHFVTVNVSDYTYSERGGWKYSAHFYVGSSYQRGLGIYLGKTVTFNAGQNGGVCSWSSQTSGTSTVTLTRRAGDSLGTLPYAYKSGYTFKGWYTTSSGGTKQTTSSTVSNSNLLSQTGPTYYAQFESNSKTYTISFYNEYGTKLSLSPSSVTTTNSAGTASITLPTVPAKTGYAGRWYDSSTKSYYSSGANLTITSNKSFTAHYTANTYTYNIFYYDVNGKQIYLSPSSATTAAAQTSVMITLPTVPTSSSLYTGTWRRGSTSGTAYNGGSQVSISGHTYFYATQTQTSVQIVYAGGAYASSQSEYTINKGINNSITLRGATYTRTGYVQTGWSTDYYGSNLSYGLSGTYSSTNGAVLYPYWSEDLRTQTFNVTNGTPSYRTLNVRYGNTVSAPVVTPNTGYQANGTWSPSLPRTCDGTRTYTYTCSPKSFTCFFNANGGSVSTSSKTVIYNSAYGTLPTPTRAGYTFNGWYTYTSGGTRMTSSSTFLYTNDITLYAQWSIQTGTLTFIDADTNTTITSYTINYGTTVSMNTYKSYSSIKDKKTGYGIKNFYTTAACSIVQGDFTMPTGTKYVYVKYQPNTYTLTYNITSATGGSQATTNVYSATVIFGENYILPAASAITPTPGYQLKGWYSSAANGTQITSSTKYTIAGNSTIYAQYEVKNYILTCDWNTTPAYSPVKRTQTFLATYNTPPIMDSYSVKPGYEVSAWYLDAAGTQSLPSKYKTIGDSTVYAQWRGRLYNLTLDLNGGYYTGGSLPTINVRYNEQISGLPTAAVLQKNECTFAYWINTDTGQRINNGDIWTTANSASIKAVWKDEYSKNCVCIVDDNRWRLFVPQVYVNGIQIPSEVITTYVYHNKKWRRVKPKYKDFPQGVR